MGRIQQGGLHGRSSVWVGPFVRIDRGKDILEGEEGLNRALGKEKHCVASWEPKITRQLACT